MSASTHGDGSSNFGYSPEREGSLSRERSLKDIALAGGTGQNPRKSPLSTETYGLQRDFSQSSELDIGPKAPSAGHLELDLEVAFRRSSQVVAYVQHLELHQQPYWSLSVTLSVEKQVSHAMSDQAALWLSFGKPATRQIRK